MNGRTGDIPFGSAMIGAAGMLTLVAFSLLLSWGMYLYARGGTSAPGEALPTFTPPGVLPPEPRLQTDPHADLLRLRSAEDSVLNSYGWVNRDSAMVRIPLARALAILSERGLTAKGRAQERPERTGKR